MTPVFQLCDEYLNRLAELDPVYAGMRGLNVAFAAASDYSPDGYAAEEELLASTLAALDRTPADGETDRLAAAYLRERLTAQLAWHRSGEPFRGVRAPFGLISSLHDSVDLLPRPGGTGPGEAGREQAWRDIAARLAAIPQMFADWRRTLAEGQARGLTAARRQALEAAKQADRYAEGGHDPLIAGYGDGPLAGQLTGSARAAYVGYAELARWLREEYAPGAAEADGVGADRYAIGARLSLGADVDPREAYEWGWRELARIEAELAAEADRIKPGASLAEVTALLDQTQYVEGAGAYLAWLRDKHEQAIAALDGRLFDIPAPLRRIEPVLATSSTSGAAYYTGPAEDLSRPGRTWWPVAPGKTRFEIWSELTTVFHEGVPGHHLQAGAARIAGDRLSRFSKITFVSGHGEGWALYAERLADELGWFSEPGTRLGMLKHSALRAARVVIDIGMHLDLPLPDGSRWSFEKGCQVLRDRGHCEPHRVHAEVVRYCGWPGQAISYKLGERAWLAARADAERRPGFDLKRWHTAALGLGPVALESLPAELARVPMSLSSPAPPVPTLIVTHE